MATEKQSKIQLLPEHIIDQIKAGEVIERPSTLLKEILENSIDAKSTEITIHIMDNGLELIHLQDNGIGINSEDLPLAFCRHATSKISRFEDIYRLHSYGFRGEALASIASISKITCKSKTSQTIGNILIEGGETKSHQTEKVSNSKTGTSFYIKDLFFNTPVRMKFIQSKTSEKNQLKKIINAFLLTHSEVAFSIKWDYSDKDFYPTRTELSERIKDTLFRDKKINFIHVENSYDGIDFKIYLTHESTRGNAHKSHYIFINDRLIQDIQIHRIILNSASHIWPEGETGHYTAYINIPADEIDVNIHPNKTVVKLFKPAQVFSLVSGAIKNYISKSNDSERGTNENQQLLSTDSSNPNEVREIDYKHINFTDNATVDNYLHNIHTKNEHGISSNHQYHALSIEEISILNIAQVPYLLDMERLLQYELKAILKEKSSEEESIPLLVSRPIKLLTPLDSESVTIINDYGFEVDLIDERTLVVRSFPKKFQKLPYLKVVEALLRNSNNPTFSELKLWDDHSYNLNELVDKFSIAELISENILLKLTAKHLRNIYEKK